MDTKIKEFIELFYYPEWNDLPIGDRMYIESILDELKYDPSNYFVELLTKSKAFDNLPGKLQSQIILKMESLLF